MLALLELGLGGGADLDDGDAAGELAEALLQLLAVPVGRGGFDGRLDGADAALDSLGAAGTLNDGGLFLRDDDLAGVTQVGKLGGVQAAAQLVAQQFAAGHGRQIAQVLLAAVSEARRLDGADVDRAAQLVHGQGGQRLAVAVVADDQQVLATALQDLLQHRQDVVNGGQLLVGDQDVRVLDRCLHALGVGHEVGADVAAVEVHAFDELGLGLDALRLLDRDHAVLADLLHHLGDQLADLLVVVRGDRGDLRHLRSAGDLDGVGLDALDDRFGRLLDAALERHRVGAGGDVLQALADDRLAEDRGGRRAVAGDVVGLGRDLLGELRADVLERVLQLDVLRDRDAVVGDRRRAELLLEDDVAALGAERDLDGVGERVDAVHEGVPRGLIKEQLLGHGFSFSYPSGFCPCGRSARLGSVVRMGVSTRRGGVLRVIFSATARLMQDLVSRRRRNSPVSEARCVLTACSFLW